MTFKGKYILEHKDVTAETFNPYVTGCPHELGYESSLESREACCDLDCRECWDRELPGESVIEHDGCFGCKHESKTEFEEPCVNCKGTVLFTSNEYESTPDLYEPMKDKESKETDAVNHPSHYNREGGMECIDEMIEIFGVEEVKIFCKLNIWKYRYRAADKNGIKDLQKSDNYMRKYKELSERERTEAI